MDIDKMIKCVQREIVMREKAYPRWVLQGKMNGAKAEEEIDQMKDVLKVLTAVRYNDSEVLKNLNSGSQTDLFL